MAHTHTHTHTHPVKIIVGKKERGGRWRKRKKERANERANERTNERKKEENCAQMNSLEEHAAAGRGDQIGYEQISLH